MMNRESLVFALSGVILGLLVGWIIGSQQASVGSLAVGGVAQQGTVSQSSSAGATSAPSLPEERVAELTELAEERPEDSAVRVELGNLYFDAERFDEAIQWYEAALQLNPEDVNVSTDLGVSYYYTNQPDRALDQFAHSLSVDPDHAKTLLNMGIVRAFGKQDLEGAVEVWNRVIQVAPDTPEARAAGQALQGVKAAHPEMAIEPSEASGATN